MRTAWEFLVGEPHPLADLQEAILEFCRGRKDVVLAGAQAVNVYAETPRMSADVDLLSSKASETATAIRQVLHERFGIAVRVRELSAESAYRVYQLRRPKNRHLADVRQMEMDLPTRSIKGLRVLKPEPLLALKILALSRRRAQPKGATDLADIRRLFLRFPTLHVTDGPVKGLLERLGAEPEVLSLWDELCRQPIEPDREEGF